MTACRSCSQELTVELDPESFDEASSLSVGQAVKAPDDVHLICGCHFHWQCLLDESAQIALSLTCPECDNSIASTRRGATATNRVLPPGDSEPQILVRYVNEGGTQNNLDILPLITEEAYLESNPAARPARAFMTMCSEGDVTSIMELLAAIEENPDDGDMTPAALLRFQDPLDDGKTGLHVAIERSQDEVVWLLLWLASRLQTEAFPMEVIRAAETLEASRGSVEAVDIRSLTDGQGRSAVDVAEDMAGMWDTMLRAGVLRVQG